MAAPLVARVYIGEEYYISTKYLVCYVVIRDSGTAAHRQYHRYRGESDIYFRVN